MQAKEIKIGKRNATFQHLVVIKINRYKRNTFNEMFVEGVRNINLAIKHGWKVKNWIYEDFNMLSSWAKEKITEVRTESNYSLSKELITELSGKTDVSELMAIMEIKAQKVEPSKNPFIVVFDRPSKKGNLGTILRSADAFGCDGVVVTGHGVDIYDPEVIVSSMGSYFATTIQKMETNEEITTWLAKLKTDYPELQIVATTEKGEDNIRAVDFKKPTILLVGNEAQGLSQFYLSLADKQVKIPMQGEASSFNVACATSIFMYEIYAQRH